jgi:hypothetical protein
VPGPQLVRAELIDDERLAAALAAWVRRRTTAQGLALRSRIVLRCAEGGTIGAVAAGLVPSWSPFIQRLGGGFACQARLPKSRLGCSWPPACCTPELGHFLAVAGIAGR